MSRPSRALVLVVLVVAAILAAWWWMRSAAEPGDRDEDQRAIDDGMKGLARREALDGSADAASGPGDFVWQRPSAVVSGYVRSEAGQGLGDAQVCLWSAHALAPSALTREPRCAETGPDGHYRIQGVPPIRTEIHAAAPGYVPSRFVEGDEHDRGAIFLAAGSERDDVDFTLVAGGVKVQGLVHDLSGGVVEGAWVEVTSHAQRGSHGWFSAPRTIGRTDADGRFAVWAAAGDVAIGVSAEGYADTSGGGPAPGAVFALFMTPESTISGRVVMAGTGQPVANVLVVAGGDGYGGGSTVLSGDDGRFVLDRLEPGTYHPTASNDAVYGSARQAVHVGLAESAADVVLQVHPMPSVFGTVIVAGTDGAPCTADGSVILTGNGGRLNFRGSVQGDGSVTIRGVRPGRYSVAARCDGLVPRADFEALVVDGAPITGQVWALDEGIAITGRVVDDAGTPVTAARVGVAMVGSGAGGGARSSAWDLTDEQGAFVAQGLRAGTYRVTFEAAGFLEAEPTEIEVGDAGIAPVELRLQRGGGVRGTVRDERGEPVAGANVGVTGARWSASASTADDGTFALDGALPGEHRVYASAAGTQAMRAPGTTDDDVQGVPVTIVADEVAQVDLVVEGQHGSISGRVLDGDGGPVADAFIDHVRESDAAAAAPAGHRERARWGSWAHDPILTDVDGTFSIAGLTEGTYTLRAYRKGGGEALAEHVTVGSTDVALAIAQTGSVGGVVTLAGGGVVDEFEVYVHDAAIGVYERDHFFRTDGVFVIAALPPGEYEIKVSCELGDATASVRLQAGSDVTDLALQLSPRIRLHGRVLDLQTHAPVPGMQVSVSARDGGRGAQFGVGDGNEPHVSDAQGRFTVDRAPVGRVHVSVLHRDALDSGYGWANLDATIPAGVQEHDMGDIFVIPRRRKPNEARGDLGLTLEQQPPADDSDDFPLKVAFVRPGGPAATAGIEVGDIVQAIDGHDATGTNRYRWYGLTDVPPGTRLSLTLTDDTTAHVIAGPGVP